MFFRKKKYDLGGNDRDSNGDTIRSSYSSSASSGYSSGSGETLSRKKELRRLSAMSQIYDGSSARSSGSSLNRFSYVPTPDSGPQEVTRKQRICPVFEQGTPVKRTSSHSTGTTQEKLTANGGCSVVQSSDDIRSQTKPAGRSEKVANGDYINTSSPQSFDNNQQQQRKQEAIHNNDNDTKCQVKQREQTPVESFPATGPTNIDDVMNSGKVLNFPPATATNDSPVSHPTTPTDNSNNNNSNSNNNNNFTAFEAPTTSESVFSLSSSSNGEQMEIKSLRQLRKLAPKSIASVTAKEDFSRPPLPTAAVAATPTVAASSTASTSNALSTPKTNLSASEPAMDIVADFADKLELESSKEKKRSIATISSISDSSSEKQPTSTSTTPPTTSPEALPRPEDSTEPSLESVQSSNGPRISYPDETDAFTTPTTPTTAATTFSITEIEDSVVGDDDVIVVDAPMEFKEDSIVTSTNIDEECQKDFLDLQVETGRHDDSREPRVVGDHLATKIYIGSAFADKKPSDDNNYNINNNYNDNYKNFHPGEENLKPDPKLPSLQSNCVSRIIIKNDTISITNADDRNEVTSSDIDTYTVPHEDTKFKGITSDLGEVRTVAGNEFERSSTDDSGHPGGDTTVAESLVDEESDARVSNSCNVGPAFDNIDHDIDLEVKGHLISPSPPPPIIDDQPTNQVKPKQPTTIGKFKLNAGSSNVSTRTTNNINRSQRPTKDEEDAKEDGYGVDDDDDHDHEYFKRKKQETIEGRNGSFRGVKNLVKSGISTFINKEESQFMKNLLEQSRGKIVLFTTSMSVIRLTRDRCSDIKKVLQNHRVYFEERDVYISDENARDLIQRFRVGRPTSANADDSGKCSNGHRPSGSGGSDYSRAEYDEMLTKLPRVYVEDFDLGGYEEVFKLNETGVLKKIFKEFPKVEGDMTCPGCGGFRYTPCHSCHGSKRSRSNAFTEEFFALRCTKCDENGLARCGLCNSDQPSGE